MGFVGAKYLGPGSQFLNYAMWRPPGTPRNQHPDALPVICAHRRDTSRSPDGHLEVAVLAQKGLLLLLDQLHVAGAAGLLPRREAEPHRVYCGALRPDEFGNCLPADGRALTGRPGRPEFGCLLRRQPGAEFRHLIRHPGRARKEPGSRLLRRHPRHRIVVRAPLGTRPLRADRESKQKRGERKHRPYPSASDRAIRHCRSSRCACSVRSRVPGARHLPGRGGLVPRTLARAFLHRPDLK